MADSIYGEEGGVNMDTALADAANQQGYILNSGNNTTALNNAATDVNTNYNTSTDANSPVKVGDVFKNQTYTGAFPTDLAGLQKFISDNKGLITAGGAALGLMGANQPQYGKSGYQGTIPELTATRNMITAPPTKEQGYRPGAGGINYGGDVTYTRTPGQDPWVNLDGNSGTAAGANLTSGLAALPAAKAANAGSLGYQNFIAGGGTPQGYLDTINAWLKANPNVTNAELQAKMKQLGVTATDLQTALGAGNYSAAEKYALTHGMGSAGVNDSINNWLAKFPNATKQQITDAMAKYGMNMADVQDALNVNKTASAADKWNLLNNRGTADVNSSINNFLALYPNATQAQKQAAMDKYGITAQDVAEATALPLQYQAAAVAAGLKPATETDIMTAYQAAEKNDTDPAAIGRMIASSGLSTAQLAKDFGLQQADLDYLRGQGYLPAGYATGGVVAFDEGGFTQDQINAALSAELAARGGTSQADLTDYAKSKYGLSDAQINAAYDTLPGLNAQGQWDKADYLANHQIGQVDSQMVVDAANKAREEDLNAHRVGQWVTDPATGKEIPLSAYLPGFDASNQITQRYLGELDWRDPNNSTTKYFNQIATPEQKATNADAWAKEWQRLNNQDINAGIAGAITSGVMPKTGVEANTIQQGLIRAAQLAAAQKADVNTSLYGMNPFGTDIVGKAMGGSIDMAKGRYLQGETDGMADKIPAKIGTDQPAALSHGEFVVPADVVSHLGNGNSDAGAKKLYQMMDKIRMARTGTKKQGKEINPDKFMPGGLAKAKFATGGDVSGSALTAGLSGVESNLSNWAGPYVTNMLGQGQALANMPYTPYMGALTAGESPLQTQAFQTAGGLTTPASIGQAATTAGGIASKAADLSYTPTTTTFDATQAQQYMNPYLQTALQPQLEEARRQSQITQQANAAKMTQAGAFGGGRQAILDAETQRALGANLANITGTGYSTAYDKAMAQFNADQARKAQEAQFGATYGLQGLQTGLQGAQTQGNLGATEAQTGLANLNAQLTAGTTQRGIEAEGIAADKAAFEEARANPYKMVQFQQSLLQGLPLAAQSYNMATPSALTSAAAGATTVADLLDILNGKTPAKKV